MTDYLKGSLIVMFTRVEGEKKFPRTLETHYCQSKKIGRVRGDRHTATLLSYSFRSYYFSSRLLNFWPRRRLDTPSGEAGTGNG